MSVSGAGRPPRESLNRLRRRGAIILAVSYLFPYMHASERMSSPAAKRRRVRTFTFFLLFLLFFNGFGCFLHSARRLGVRTLNRVKRKGKIAIGAVSRPVLTFLFVFLASSPFLPFASGKHVVICMIARHSSTGDNKAMGTENKKATQAVRNALFSISLRLLAASRPYTDEACHIMHPCTQQRHHKTDRRLPCATVARVDLSATLDGCLSVELLHLATITALQRQLST